MLGVMMKAQKIITTLLLIFVAVSVVAIVVKNVNATKTDPVSGEPAAKTDTGSKPTGPESTDKEKIVVYYFHGNMRCPTCMTIEAMTRKAVDGSFSDEKKNGLLELRAVNLETEGNGHYVEDYQLSVRTVVISKLKDNKEVEWKRLDRVWELAADESEYLNYISSEINSILKKGS
ncbi:MAG: hypothetical protein JXR97_14965 [Planctomycetes bacterium]|nr:hypothetical protein [Planctomycetota bacterium]